MFYMLKMKFYLLLSGSVFLNSVVTFPLNKNVAKVDRDREKLAETKAREIKEVENMIGKVAHYVNYKRKNELAKIIWDVSIKYRLSPRLIVAIIDTESDFIKGKISHTGDLSIAQINPRVWNKELKRLGKGQLDTNLLMTDEEYALKRMGEILSIIKEKYERKDSVWFCRYHSGSHKFKMRYFKKILGKLELLASL